MGPLVDADRGQIEDDHPLETALNRPCGNVAGRQASPGCRAVERLTILKIQAEDRLAGADPIRHRLKVVRAGRRLEGDNDRRARGPLVNERDEAIRVERRADARIKDQVRAGLQDLLVRLPAGRITGNRIQVGNVQLAVQGQLHERRGDRSRGRRRDQVTLDRAILITLSTDAANDVTIFQIDNGNDTHAASLA